MLNESRVSLSNVRMDKAKEEYAVAVYMLEAGHFNAANARAYYAVFHSMRAVLALDAVDFKSHSQVIGYFTREYVNSGVFDRDFGRYIRETSKLRNRSDYEDYFEATRADAEQNAEKAKAFVESVAEYVEKRIKSEYIRQELGGEDELDFEGDED